MGTTAFGAEKGPLPVAELKRAEAVNFDREVLPFLNENCLSCHCQTTTKGGLNLETPQLMLKGGESGPALVPGKAAESLLFQAAIHQDADLAMPPRENKAKAKDLTPEQLALLRLWIDQGAKPSPKTERVLTWQPLPESLRAIFAVAVTPEGQFAACSRANRLSIYHLPSGRCVLSEAAHRDQINAIAFSPDGALAATAAYREVKLWRRAPEMRVFTLKEAGAPLAVSPDGKWIAAVDASGSVRVWTWPGTGSPRTLSAAGEKVAAIAFSPDSAKLAFVAGQKLTLCATADGETQAQAEIPAATALAWVAGGRLLASGGADGIVRLWSGVLAAERELKGHGGAVTALAAVGANHLLSGSADGTARVWDLEKGESFLQLAHGATVTSVAVRPDEQRFATAGENGIAKLWDAGGQPVGQASGDRYLAEAAAARDRVLQVEVGNVAYRKGEIAAAEKAVTTAQEHVKKAEDALVTKEKDLAGKKTALAQAQEEKKTIALALFDAEAEVLKNAAAPESEASKGAAAKRKAASDKVAALVKKLSDAEAAMQGTQADRDSAVKAIAQAKAEVEKATAEVGQAKGAADAAEAIRARAEKELADARAAMAGAVKPVRALAFSPDGAMLATAGDDQLIHTWSATNGAAFDVYKGHAAAVAALAFAPGGELVSAAQNHTAIAWDFAPRWKLERTIGGSEGKSPLTDRVNAVAFSHDGKLLATGSGEPSRSGEVKLWDVATGALKRDLPKLHVDAVLALEFSPDDKFLASGSADKIARVTDLATGKMVRNFEGHTHHVLSLAWSPDGRTLVTSGADNAVKVWNFTTGDRVRNVEGYEKEVTAVRFAGATGNLLTGSGDNKVRLVGLGGNELRTIPVPAFVEAAAVTADGQTILAGGEDGTLRVWNAEGKSIGEFAK